MRYLLFILTLTHIKLCAGVFYVDPENGNPQGDGSAKNPWRTLEEVFENNLIETQIPARLPYVKGTDFVVKNAGAPIKAGDTISLLSGYHGDIDYTGAYNDGVITIEAKDGHTPRLRRVKLRSVNGWTLRGLTVSASFATDYDNVTAIEADSHAHTGPADNVIVENCLIYSTWDTSDWSQADWNNNAASGIILQGDYCEARSNWLRNVNFGISSSGDHNLVENNTIENFSGDGIRGLGDSSTFQYNVVKNCYDVNANHDDGFQSWSVGEEGVGTGVVKGIVLRGNTFINYTDPGQPHRGTLQAIGCFDGLFEDWVVEERNNPYHQYRD